MSILHADGSLVDPYCNFIALSRYARFRDDLGRRETWAESVDRYVDFMVRHVTGMNGYKPDPELVKEIRQAIKNLDIDPSMRAIMTAGPALEESNIAAYNCAYTPIDDIDVFSEILYILMHGTGVGYSVERRYVSQLPEVPILINDHTKTIVVGDSKLGWATAYRELLHELWLHGRIPAYDLSAIRPAGARLKTFGGRASGPEPLRELFDYTIDTLFHAQGRKLTTLEVHDLVCKIASVVVVGGVRRSAMIALSDLDDEDMRMAKSGEWWTEHPHRRLANISAVYYDNTSIRSFHREWQALVESGSGERGIFNRDAARRQATKRGNREYSTEYGTNPCGEIILRPRGFCNLSEVIVRPVDTEETLARKVVLATILGTWQSTLTHFPFLRDEWRRNAEEERLLGVSITGVFGNPLLYSQTMRRKTLERLNKIAIQVNAEYAHKLGIPTSAAVTCVKPSGTVSQLAGVSSGLHPWYAKQYLRAVRVDNKDPIGQLMRDYGVPCEDDVMAPDSTWVFYFPIAAPNFGVTRDQLTAIDHLELWLDYKRYWCDHNPSVTVSVRDVKVTDPGPFSKALAKKLVLGDENFGAWDSDIRDEFLRWVNESGVEDTIPRRLWCEEARKHISWAPGEWDAVRDWVWEHLDEITGVTFLPFADEDHTYAQAPYRSVDYETYLTAKKDFPQVRWADLVFYESADMTIGSQELACTAGACDVVDIVRS